MNHRDEERIMDFYEKAFSMYGNDARSVHWSNEHNQKMRFEALNKIADLSGSSVLDVGSGLGDLYKFFATKKISVDYTGIDIVPGFINRARERFPEARFLLEDIEMLDNDYDYILASGALSFAVEGGKEHYYKIIKKMFSHSRKGLAFNMLNEFSHPSDETYLAYNIGEVIAYCKTLSPDVVLVADYLPWDFTVYLYKE